MRTFELSIHTLSAAISFEATNNNYNVYVCRSTAICTDIPTRCHTEQSLETNEDALRSGPTNSPLVRHLCCRVIYLCQSATFGVSREQSLKDPPDNENNISVSLVKLCREPMTTKTAPPRLAINNQRESI